MGLGMERVNREHIWDLTWNGLTESIYYGTWHGMR